MRHSFWTKIYNKRRADRYNYVPPVWCLSLRQGRGQNQGLGYYATSGWGDRNFFLTASPSPNATSDVILVKLHCCHCEQSPSSMWHIVTVTSLTTPSPSAPHFHLSPTSRDTQRALHKKSEEVREGKTWRKVVGVGVGEWVCVCVGVGVDTCRKCMAWHTSYLKSDESEWRGETLQSGFDLAAFILPFFRLCLLGLFFSGTKGRLSVRWTSHPPPPPPDLDL